MNDVLRIARLKIALQRAFLGRAILRVIIFPVLGKLTHMNDKGMPWDQRFPKLVFINMCRSYILVQLLDAISKRGDQRQRVLNTRGANFTRKHWRATVPHFQH